jgi:hypothetical protein
MTSWPKPFQWSAVSTTTRPVSEAADTAVNSASTRPLPWPLRVVNGLASRTVPIAMTVERPTRNATAARAGGGRCRMRGPANSG